MKINRIVPDLTVDDLAKAIREHTEVLGMEIVMDHGWIVTLTTERWGVRRFFYRDSSGRVINVGTHA